jgi:hypothetical protein
MWPFRSRRRIDPPVRIEEEIHPDHLIMDWLDLLEDHHYYLTEPVTWKDLMKLLISTNETITENSPYASWGDTLAARLVYALRDAALEEKHKRRNG